MPSHAFHSSQLFCTVLPQRHLVGWVLGRSVQTALSLAESIGYSPEFVAEPADAPGFQQSPDGIIMAGVLCTCAALALFVGGTSYAVLTIVA